ncbi:MAG: ATP-binding protein [Candidatus Velthaea sp.]|jgi:anti-sigma regulatory factor (Ser/Thr protein kinase)
MTAVHELRVSRTASAATPKTIRYALDAFLKKLALPDERREDIILAVGEALANAAEHAYAAQAAHEAELIELHAVASPDGRRIAVEIKDSGSFVEPTPHDDRGFGFHIMRSIAHEVAIETGAGTRVRLIFEQ